MFIAWRKNVCFSHELNFVLVTLFTSSNSNNLLNLEAKPCESFSKQEKPQGYQKVTKEESGFHSKMFSNEADITF